MIIAWDRLPEATLEAASAIYEVEQEWDQIDDL
jgi:hypothetical protein